MGTKTHSFLFIKYALKRKDFTDDDIKIDYANDRIIVQWECQ